MIPEENRKFEQAVAERLKDLLGPRSQEHYAPKLSVSQGTLSRYGQGKIPKSWRFLANLREVEGVDLNEFLGSK